MNNENPYASPLSDPQNPFASPMSAGGGFQYESTGEGLWRKGSLLVVDKYAPLPDRCVKSNEPAFGRKLKRKLTWHHPWIYLLILVSLWIYIIVALIVQKRATIEIGLSERWFSKRRTAMLVGWGAGLAGVAMIVMGIAAADNANNAAPALLLLAGLLFFLFGLIFGIAKSSMVTAKRIDERYVWVKGVHPDFLAPLPEWPYNP